MAGSFDFTIDNVAGPDSYIVSTVCSRLRMFEKDRSVTTLAPFNVYIPNSSAGSKVQFQGGEEFDLAKGTFQASFSPNERPFQAETVGIVSRVFTVIEE